MSVLVQPVRSVLAWMGEVRRMRVVRKVVRRVVRVECILSNDV
jgi:hypothetical protein